jgi:hypothetical protein
MTAGVLLSPDHFVVSFQNEAVIRACGAESESASASDTASPAGKNSNLEGQFGKAHMQLEQVPMTFT